MEFQTPTPNFLAQPQSPSIIPTLPQFLSVKLNDANFLLWKNQLLNVAIAYGLSGYLDGTITPPPQFMDQQQSQPNSNYYRWERNNRLLMCWIYSSLSEQKLSEIASLETASQIWSSLNRAYDSKPELRRIQKDGLSLSLSSNPQDENERAPTSPIPKTELQRIRKYGISLSLPNSILHDKNQDAPTSPIPKNDRNYSKRKSYDYTSPSFTAVDSHVEPAAVLSFNCTAAESYTLDVQQRVCAEEWECRGEKESESVPLKVRLCQAAIKGDWKTAKCIFDSDSSAVTMKITDAGETALHIASAAKHICFVENLVKLTSSSDLAARNDRGQTALFWAATSGVVRIARVMVDKNPNLPNLHDPNKLTPLTAAVFYKRRDMASFIFSKTNFEAIDTCEQIELLFATIEIDCYDIALDILKRKPELANEQMDDGVTALHLLACKQSSAIGSSNKLSFWRRYIYSCFKGVYNKALMQTLAHQLVEYLWKFVVHKLPEGELLEFIRGNSSSSRLLHDAARVGNIEFLVILIRSYPHFLWEVDEDNKTIFHTAIENRQESVFSLIYEIGGLSDSFVGYYDEKKNYNMLHLAGKIAAPHHLNKVSGAALQMQRELFWFKEVEKIVVSNFHREDKDKIDGLTPRELFTEQHKKLLKDDEEWMKSTANSCMLVATLIATVVFAAAFTVPGGNDGNKGVPIFRQNSAFTVFVISDVIALVLSTSSILTFLSILTSRYAEADFLVSLPTKLLVGLVMLFVSIVCMVVAFSTTFFMAYDKMKVKIPLAIAGAAIIPIGCFCVFHYKLVVDILRYAYWSKFSLRPWKKSLF